MPPAVGSVGDTLNDPPTPGGSHVNPAALLNRLPIPGVKPGAVLLADELDHPSGKVPISEYASKFCPPSRLSTKVSLSASSPVTKDVICAKLAERAIPPATVATRNDFMRYILFIL